MRFVIITIWLLLSAAYSAAGQSLPNSKKDDVCSIWIKRVYPVENVPDTKTFPSTVSSEGIAAEVNEIMSNKPSDPDHVSGLTDDQAISAIGCLLTLENDADRSRFVWSRPNISESFGPPTVNVSALYYISYIFTKNFKHANATALRGSRCGVIRNGQYYTKESCIHTAYKAYRRWFAKVKKIGLESARQQNLDPLERTGVTWY